MKVTVVDPKDRSLGPCICYGELNGEAVVEEVDFSKDPIPSIGSVIETDQGHFTVTAVEWLNNDREVRLTAE